jgi:hypothetical protein
MHLGQTSPECPSGSLDPGPWRSGATATKGLRNADLAAAIGVAKPSIYAAFGS